MWENLFIFVLAFSVFLSDGRESRVVNISQGPIRGYKEADDGLFAFYGIPYATAPLGRNKYKASLPAPEWSEVFEAVDKKIICPHKDLLGYNRARNLIIKEDCLIANILVPDVDDINLPVVVYVHGGAYLLGYADLLTYRSLVKSHKVIVVSFNYRLGVHGFLCLGTKNIPGNAGLKDQVVLLRWVKDNINKFGGNPDDVTLAGYSAGSSAADLLMLSNKANGLFNKVILESGVGYNSFGFQIDPISYAKDYAKLLNFTDVEDFESLEEFYLTASDEVLFAALSMDRKDSAVIMSPCIERDISGVDTFLGDNPINILKHGDYQKVPILIGFTNREGMWRLPEFEQWKTDMNENFSDFLPIDLQFESETERDFVANKIKSFYFGDSPVSGENILSYIDFFSDCMFTYSTLLTVTLQVEAGNKNVYLYEYSFLHENENIIPYKNIRGPKHCMQCYAIADGNYTYTKEREITQGHKNIKKFLRQLWYNFIKTGKPILDGSELPTWPPVGKNRSPHMVLDQPLQLKGSLLEERYLFWQDIYDKYGRQPSAPHIPRAKLTEL